MAANRLDQPKPAEEAKPAAAAAAPAPAKGGGTWVPLIANIVLMPVIAWALTTFVLIPKIKAGGATASHEPTEDGSHNPAKAKVTVPLAGKVLVNVAGTAGTRYLVANITLVGKKPEPSSSDLPNV